MYSKVEGPKHSIKFALVDQEGQENEPDVHSDISYFNKYIGSTFMVLVPPKINRIISF